VPVSNNGKQRGRATWKGFMPENPSVRLVKGPLAAC
jgi:hypothetical protein